MKSARINFGIGAESEYVLEVDDTGAATRCFNPVTGQELGGGGSSYYTITNSEDSTTNIIMVIDTVSPSTGDFIGDISLDAGGTLNILSDYHYYVSTDLTSANGSYEEVEINGDSYYHITGDVTFEITD